VGGAADTNAVLGGAIDRGLAAVHDGQAAVLDVILTPI
jgi:hypothetical protein